VNFAPRVLEIRALRALQGKEGGQPFSSERGLPLTGKPADPKSRVSLRSTGSKEVP
jgi:hypothetical protein